MTAILTQLKGGIAGIYIQKKLDKFEETTDTQNWNKFVRELKTILSDKSKAAGAE